MKVLLITYYWPPAGGVAVRRWMKFARLLDQRPDIDLVVYAPEDPDYPETDPDLAKEVSQLTTWKHPIFEPYGLFRFFTGKNRKYKVKQEFATASGKGLLDKIAVWIRGNFFIPDARKFWIRPSVRYLADRWDESGGFDCVISNGTPHSVHLIALELKKKFSFRWIADFRDPWTTVDYFDDLYLMGSSKARHRKLEKRVLSTADHVVTVSPTWAADLRELGAEQVSVITNGFDPSDFPASAEPGNTAFAIAHVGNLNRKRNKAVFWNVISRLCQDVDGFRDDLRIKLVGMIDPSVEQTINTLNLTDVVQLQGQVGHDEAVTEMVRSQVLLLLVGEDGRSAGRIPAKVFEYFAARRPVLAIVPDQSDVRGIIDEAGAGQAFSSNEEEGIYEFLRDRYQKFRENIPFHTGSNVNQFTRSALADQMAALILDHS